MLKMGCAAADITPDFKCFLRGYGNRTDMTDKAADNIEVGVIALEKDGKQQLILTVDSLGMAENNCDMVRENIRQQFDIDPKDVVIACSHTHFAPEMDGFAVAAGGGMPWGIYPADERFRELWLARVMPAVAAALDDLEEVELLETDVKIGCIAYNRRTVRKSDGMVNGNYVYPEDPENYHFSPIDDTMTIWKFMRNDRSKAILARYSCHAVTGGSDHNAISADFPGAFRKSVREKMDCPAFYINGTAGDVVPLRRFGTSRQDIGEVMANAVKLAELTFRKVDQIRLKSATATVRVTIPELIGKSAKDVEKLYQDSLRSVQGKIGFDENFYMTSRLQMMYDHWHTSEVSLPLQIIQLGSRVLVCLPFDVLTVIGEKIAEAFPDALVVGYSGGGYGYLFLPEDAAKGGYETSCGTSFSINTGKDFIAAILELLKQFA